MNKLSTTSIVRKKLKQCLMVSVGVLSIVQLLAIAMAEPTLDPSQRFSPARDQEDRNHAERTGRSRRCRFTGSWLGLLLVAPKWP